MKKMHPISIYGPKPVQAWEWALVYPAFWLLIYVIGPIVDRWRYLMAEVIRGGNVSQAEIDTLLEAFKNGDHSAADTLWDLQEYMTAKQCADTAAKVHRIIG